MSSRRRRSRKQGSVVLDLGRPRNQVWALPLLAVVVLLIGLGGAWVTGWDGVAIAAAVIAVGVSRANLFSVSGRNEMREGGLVAGGQFFPWPDFTWYQFCEACLEFTVRVSAPLNVQELAGAVAFDPELRPKVEVIVARMTPHLPSATKGEPTPPPGAGFRDRTVGPDGQW